MEARAYAGYRGKISLQQEPLCPCRLCAKFMLHAVVLCAKHADCTSSRQSVGMANMACVKLLYERITISLDSIFDRVILSVLTRRWERICSNIARQ